jgi:Txe/YoeB family toxin of Txe-Axe toxin-antitoxin module
MRENVVTPVPEPWLIHFFQRHSADDPARAVPTIDFLDGLQDKLAAEIQAVLEAVAAAPPPSFSGGGKWEAMHDDMAGFYEVRVQGGGVNHRLFCLLDRNADDLGGPSLICLDGLSKPVRSAASPRDYRRVRQYADEFRKHRTVYRESDC